MVSDGYCSDSNNLDTKQMKRPPPAASLFVLGFRKRQQGGYRILSISSIILATLFNSARFYACFCVVCSFPWTTLRIWQLDACPLTVVWLILLACFDHELFLNNSGTWYCNGTMPAFQEAYCLPLWERHRGSQDCLCPTRPALALEDSWHWRESVFVADWLPLPWISDPGSVFRKPFEQWWDLENVGFEQSGQRWLESFLQYFATMWDFLPRGMYGDGGEGQLVVEAKCAWCKNTGCPHFVSARSFSYTHFV